MNRLRAFLLLGIFVISIICRTTAVHAQNPFSHSEAKTALFSLSDSGDLRADEVAPLKVAKIKRRICHVPPHSLLLIGEILHHFIPINFRFPLAALRTHFSFLSGPDTPPPIAPAFVRILA